MNRLQFFLLAIILFAQVAYPQANLIRNQPPPPGQDPNRPPQTPPPQERPNPPPQQNIDQTLQQNINPAAQQNIDQTLQQNINQTLQQTVNTPPQQTANPPARLRLTPPPQNRLNPANAIRNNPHPPPQQTTTTPITELPRPGPNPNPTDKYINLRSWLRSFDGTGNNLQFINWGSTGQPQSRFCPNDFVDGLSVMRTDLPNPRQLSNSLGDVRNLPGGKIELSLQNRNMLFMIWGQFLDHDIGLTSFAATQSVPMSVPKCDKFFDPDCTGTQSLPFMRSAFDPNQALRTQINLITAWIDGSQIYGSTKADADALRSFTKGKLLTSSKNMLPKDDNGFYISGDIRTNENIGLTALQTIFLREHNRICNIISSMHPNLSDEEIFQMARNYVVALCQKITFDDFLPGFLGQTQQDALIGPYVYQSNLNPDLFTEFNTAAFRIGHVLMNSPYELIDNNGNVLKKLDLGQIFQNPDLVTNENMAHIINGLLRVKYKQRSLELIDDLRNFLVSGQFGTLKIDLFAANVQRGRDHGICTYKQARQQLNIPEDTFANIFNGPNSDNGPNSRADRVQREYKTLDRVDLWVGIIGQQSMESSDLGEVGGRIVAAQFKKIRNADRLWYENVMSDYPGLLQEIKRTTLGDIIKRNSNVNTVNAQSFITVV